MLTGRYPYPVVGTMVEVLRNIAEAEPQRPSTWNRLTRSGYSTPQPSHHRVNNELETIVLRALAKDRERCYQSVGTLGDDVERYLKGEPIEAKRDSRLYVLRKTLAPYKRAAVLIGTSIILLGVVGTTALRFWHKTNAMAHANRLVGEATVLIAQRTRLEDARYLLDEAI